MCICLRIPIKSPERPCLCHSAVFIGSPVHVLQIAYCWLWRPHCYMIRVDIYRKVSKDFEANGFHCYILNITLFLESVRKSKKKYDVRKSKDVQQTKCYMQKVTFYVGDYVYSASELCHRQTKWYMQKIPSVTWIMCAKFQNYNIWM